MRCSIRGLQQLFQGHSHDRRCRKRRPAVEGLEERSLLSAVHSIHAHPRHDPSSHLRANAYQQTNLVSDFPKGVEGVNAQLQDPSLLNPWGLVRPRPARR